MVDLKVDLKASYGVFAPQGTDHNFASVHRIYLGTFSLSNMYIDTDEEVAR